MPATGQAQGARPGLVDARPPRRLPRRRPRPPPVAPRPHAAGAPPRRRTRTPGAIRVGYTCSKKVGNAVARNRAKRRLRAAARAVLPERGVPGWDYVLIGRPEVTAARPFASLCDDLASARRAPFTAAGRTRERSAARRLRRRRHPGRQPAPHPRRDGARLRRARRSRCRRARRCSASSACRCHEAMAALAPHLPEADTLRLADHYRDRFVAQRAAGGAEAHAPLYPGALAALERLAAEPGDAARGRHRQGPARPRPRLRRPRPRALLRHRPDRRRPPVEAASLDAARRARRDRLRRRRPRSMVGDTEFDMAMGRAAGLATVGVSLGLPPARAPERRRRRRRSSTTSPRSTPRSPASGPARDGWGPRRRFWRAATVRPGGRRLRRRPRRPPADAPPPARRWSSRPRRCRAPIAAEWDALDGEIAPRPAAADPRRQLGDRPGGARSARR